MWFKKGTKLYSIWNEKCPVCHEGDSFLTKKKYELRSFDKMHKYCSVCNHKFEIETGFWQGAMYVSYAVTVAFSVALFLLTYLIYSNTGVWMYISIISFGALVFAPINYRLSRMIWMNMFSTFSPLK